MNVGASGLDSVEAEVGGCGERAALLCGGFCVLRLRQVEEEISTPHFFAV